MQVALDATSLSSWLGSDPGALTPVIGESFLSPAFSSTQLFPRSWVGIQALVTMVVTPGPGAAAVSGNLTIPALLEYFGATGTGESPLPAVHHPYVCPYIYPCLLSRPRV